MSFVLYLTNGTKHSPADDLFPALAVRPLSLSFHQVSVFNAMQYTPPPQQPYPYPYGCVDGSSQPALTLHASEQIIYPTVSLASVGLASPQLDAPLPPPQTSHSPQSQGLGDPGLANGAEPADSGFWFVAMAFVHNVLRIALYCAVVWCYVLFGGYIFHLLEDPYARQQVAQTNTEFSALGFNATQQAWLAENFGLPLDYEVSFISPGPSHRSVGVGVEELRLMEVAV